MRDRYCSTNHIWRKGGWKNGCALTSSHTTINEPFMVGIGRLDSAQCAADADFAQTDIMTGFRKFTHAMTRLEPTLDAIADQ